MPALSDYTSGTITLTNGSVNFTGAGTGWQAADFREGDTILGIEDNAGVEYVIASITGNGAGTLTQEWEGATGTYTYRMRYLADGARVTAQARNLIELLGNGNLQALAGLTGPGVPVFNGPHAMTVKPEADFVNGVAYNVQVDTLADRAAYDGQSEGFAVLVSDMGDGRSALFSKASNTSGDWTDPAYITGPIGPLPEVEATVTSLPPGSAATVTPAPITGGVRLDFELPEASGFYNAGVYDIAEAYSQDDVVRHNGSSFIALQAVPAGTSPSGAFPPVDTAYWQVLAAKGADGAGTGDVVGPAGAVDGRIAVFDGTTGKLIKGLTAEDAPSARRNLGLPGVRSLDDVSVDRPLYIAHGGQTQLYPEQSLGSYRMSAGSAVVDALECDVRKLSDGTLVCFHDTTVDRVTSSTGNVESLTADSFRALHIDAERWHGANVPDGQTVSFFADVLREFAGLKLFVPEVKTAGAGQDVVDALVEAGIGPDQAIVQSFSFADLEPAVLAGYPTMYLTAEDTDIAAAQLAGVTWVGISQAASSSVFTAWVNAGFKVVAWTVNRRWRRDELLALGVVGFFSDDVEYLARDKSLYSDDRFASGAWMPGMLAIGESLTDAERGRFFPDGSWGWASPTSVNTKRRFVLQGWGDLQDECAIFLRVRFGKAAEPHWAAVFLADESMSDRQFRDDNTDTYVAGYNVLLRDNGGLAIYRVDAGVATLVIEDPAGESIARGGEVLYRVKISPTEIEAASMLPDGSAVRTQVTAVDDTYRGRIFHLGGRHIALQFRDIQVVGGGDVPRSRMDAVDVREVAVHGGIMRAHIHGDGTLTYAGRVVNYPISGITNVPFDLPVPFIDANIAVAATPETQTPSSYSPITIADVNLDHIDLAIYRTLGESTYFRYAFTGRWK